MSEKFTFWIIRFFLAVIVAPVHAENLIQVYQAARLSSPDIIEAAADNEAAREGIEGARSVLLPQLSLSGSSGWAEGMRANTGMHSRSTDSSLSLSQTLFNMSSFQTMTIQEKQAALQKITYESTQQTLILDVATAYFNTLKAIDSLSYTETEKQSVGQLLEQTTRKFQVGSLAITDMQNVQAQYDQVLLSEVTAQNELDNSAEALREVSGRSWGRLATLQTVNFRPHVVSDVGELLKLAKKSSLQLVSARLSSDIAKTQIEAAKAGHMPTVSLSASVGISGSRSRQDDNYGKNISGSRQMGISVSVPLYSGGGVTAAVKQSEYAWISASEREEHVRRNMIKSIRSDFNNINAAVSSIRAGEQTVKSAQASLEATQNGYQAGSRTMLDVLDATTTLYNARRSLSAARYDYLLAGLTLKNEQGQLSFDDLRACNAYLGNEIDIQL